MKVLKVKLKSKRKIENSDVYDITTKNTHSFLANNILVHNCGEQPLTAFAVCNLAAINLANMVDKNKKQVNWKKLKEIVRIGVKMQDNVIDATPYFLEENRKQALGERRIGLGIMGLADLLIKCEVIYGSEEGNKLIDKIFETIAITAYETSIELAKEKGAFPYMAENPSEVAESFVQ